MRENHIPQASIVAMFLTQFEVCEVSDSQETKRNKRHYLYVIPAQPLTKISEFRRGKDAANVGKIIESSTIIIKKCPIKVK